MMIKLDIKWEEYFIACGESDLTEEISKKNLWNLETPKKYGEIKFVVLDFCLFSELAILM